MTQRTTLAAYRRPILASFIAVISALFACSNGNDDDVSATPSSGNSLLLNFTSDYATGVLRWMDLNSTSLSTGAIDFHQDSRVFVAGGNIFLLERAPVGNLSCISSDVSTIKQKRLEARNPYEVAVIGNKGYIALNDADYVQVFDVSTCTPSEKIDLPIPGANASTIKASGDTLLLTLQRLDGWSATKPGLLVRIKASTKTLIDTIPLKFYNPSSSVLNKGTLIVASSNWGTGNEGIEIADWATKTSKILADNVVLGSGVSDIALDEANQILYASVYVAFGNSPIKPIDLATKTVGNALPNIIDASGGLVFDKEGKKLFVGDRSSGLKVYDPVANTTAAIGNQNLPPLSLAIHRTGS